MGCSGDTVSRYFNGLQLAQCVERPTTAGWYYNTETGTSVQTCNGVVYADYICMLSCPESPSEAPLVLEVGRDDRRCLVGTTCPAGYVLAENGTSCTFACKDG